MRQGLLVRCLFINIYPVVRANLTKLDTAHTASYEVDQMKGGKVTLVFIILAPPAGHLALTPTCTSLCPLKCMREADVMNDSNAIFTM